ncbi:sigma-70 family RNA polymerase sigma factor [Ktedonosporobacter rubrisoli]|uniref:Sigma-70 family RNA polymerase sigma factor n=1 Tax=Ktedonosporobacter rubrisoli TaxID=2509675 RepID=A0A4P6K018_KTERU|nr:sigma-70 family RNA polymerase sigma factor [Ktedonosporobacter rubrisoli]QBD81518.1 sigma-70 family RNA polymerase sigma factor [Ktedonosporobacter rubrisoli]
MDKLARDDEELLIARSKRGDVNAFNQLILHYQPIMFSAIFRLLGDYDTAADITQDAFLAAFRGVQTYRGGSSFRAWLLRIGTNLVYDHWRRIQRRPAESLELLTEEDEPHSSESLSALITTGIEDNPEESLLSQELQGLIQQALEQLPFDQRTAIVLCDIQGLSYEEVAAATQATLGTVRSRISRGRTRLRQYLYQYRELLPRDYRLTKSSQEPPPLEGGVER